MGLEGRRERTGETIHPGVTSGHGSTLTHLSRLRRFLFDDNLILDKHNDDNIHDDDDGD